MPELRSSGSDVPGPLAIASSMATRSGVSKRRAPGVGRVPFRRQTPSGSQLRLSVFRAMLVGMEAPATMMETNTTENFSSTTAALEDE